MSESGSGEPVDSSAPNDKEFSCDDCSKTYATHGGLIYHVRNTDCGSITCPECGIPYPPGGLCKECSLERAHGVPADHIDSDGDDEWTVAQQGLGDRDAEGQATLDGGIRKESEANE